MTRPARLLCLAILVTASFQAAGCKKASEPGSTEAMTEAKSEGALCSLLTDAEVEAATKLKVGEHHGDDVGCKWNIGGGAQSGFVSVMKSSDALEKSAPRNAPPKLVPGVGESAEWLGGATPTLVIRAKGGVYRLAVTSPPLMTAGSGENASVDFPELKAAATTLGKALVGRL